jgi:hypothetical protein
VRTSLAGSPSARATPVDQADTAKMSAEANTARRTDPRLEGRHPVRARVQSVICNDRER